MKQIKILLANAVMATGLLLTACTSPDLYLAPGVASANGYIYNGINFGTDRNTDFRQGVRDACRTADGDYTKDHNKFKNNESYKIGWEDGRLQCKGK